MNAARWSRRIAGALTSRRERARWKAIDVTSRAQRRTGSPSVALTFDDGPQPGTTDRILDLLAAHQVQATFFCVGRNAVAHPGLLRRIRDEGHAVGSHSFSHPDPERTSLRRLTADYRAGVEAVSDSLGETVSLFRPPRGFLDGRRAVQLRLLGLPPTLWSLDPQDWHPDARAETIAEVVGRAGAGEVVLLHDWVESPWDPAVLTRQPTIDALPQVISSVRARGLTFSCLRAP